MKITTTSDNLNLLVLIQPLWKWWWLLALSGILAAFSSALYSMQLPNVYSATTTIMVGTALSDPNPSGSEFVLASQLAAAYADIASRSTLQDATKEALGLTWLPEYQVGHIPNTQLLEITVVDTIPERAQTVSQALADQLILQSPAGQTQQGRQQFIETQLLQIEEAIAETDAEIERLELEMAQMFSARQIADTKAQLAALESKRATMQNNYAAMFGNSTQSATNTIVVVEAAPLPTKPLNSDLLRNVLLAGILGAAIAGAGAYVLEFSNSTLKSELEVQNSLDLTSLGLLPQSDADAKHSTGLLSSFAHRSALSDAYAALRLNLQTVLRRHNIHTLAITCATSDERRPSVAANLCVELAWAGARVILVDADLHRPSQQRIFGLTNHFGLATLLSDDTLQPTELLQTTDIPGLSVLTSGPLPANPTALLSSQHMRTILTQLRLQADLVVFDVPPVNAVVDASLVATEVDGVILTVVAERTRKQEAEKTIQILNRLDVQIIGTVMCSASMPTATQQYGYQARPKTQEVPQQKSEIVVYKHGNEGTQTLKNDTSAASALLPKTPTRLPLPIASPASSRSVTNGSVTNGSSTISSKSNSNPAANSTAASTANHVGQPSRRNPFAKH